MNKKVQVSIIIPAYNAENYIERCVQSALNQTFKNIEILVIDDGSKDRTQQICDAMAAGNNRIRVFHTSNKGVAAARNLGIAKSTGQYIQFIDSDDTIESTLTEQLYSAIKIKKDSISLCGYNIISGGRVRIIKPEQGWKDIYSFIETMNYWMISPIIGSPCNKLFSRNIIEENDICFPDGVPFAEDYIFNITYFKYVSSFFCIDQALYNYYVDTDNSLHTTNGDNIEARWKRCTEIVTGIENLLEEHGILNNKFVANIFSYLLTDNLVYRIEKYNARIVREWINNLLKNKKYADYVQNSSRIIQHPRATIIISCLKNMINGCWPQFSFVLLRLLYINKIIKQKYVKQDELTKE